MPNDYIITVLPAGTNIKILLTDKPTGEPATLSESMLYNLTVGGIADAVNHTIRQGGSLILPNFPEEAHVGRYAKRFEPSMLEFVLAADEAQADHADLQTVADVLKGIQQLSHEYLLQELFFVVFDLSQSDQPLIATGCLAYQCEAGPDVPPSLYSQTETPDLSTKTLTTSGEQVASNTSGGGVSNAVYTMGGFDDGVKLVIARSGGAAEPIIPTNFADVAVQSLWRVLKLVSGSPVDPTLPSSPGGGSGVSNPNWLARDEYFASSLSMDFYQSGDKPFTLGTLAKTMLVMQLNMDKMPLTSSSIVVGIPSGDPNEPWMEVGSGCIGYQQGGQALCTASSHQTGNLNLGSGGPFNNVTTSQAVATT